MLTMKADTSNAGIVRVKASGTVTKADMQAFVPEFDRIAGSSGPVRMLIELDDFTGWDAGGLWEDIKFDVSRQRDLARVAIVGDKVWQLWGTWLSKPFFLPEIRYFDRSEAAQAETWLKQGNPWHRKHESDATVYGPPH